MTSWELTEQDVDRLALGATLLGTGGGGDPYIAKLMLAQAIADHGPVTIVDPTDLPPDGLVLTSGMIGAPTVVLEKIPSGTECRAAVEALARYLGRRPVAIMPIEVGGLNTLVPLVTAVEMGLPVIDADGMRRAFPQIEMTVFTLAGIGATPMAVADEKGNLAVFETTGNRIAETLARGAVIELGLNNGMSCYPMSARQVAEHAVLGSIRYCMEVGRRLADVQQGTGELAELLAYTGGIELFSGKVIDVERRTTEGFARGAVTMEGLSDPSRSFRVEIQNENLVAFDGDRSVVTVPDLICLLDHESADPITTEKLAYGQRLDVIALPCAPEWDRPGMLDVVGPAAFGYRIEHHPLQGGHR